MTGPHNKAVHAWSLDKTLGSPRVPGPGGSGSLVAGGSAVGALDLLDLPAALAERGFSAVQLIHFQLPTRDRGYLSDLRAALAESNIDLNALLVDDGDLTHPTDGDTHEKWISEYLDDAEFLGATYARVAAGRSAPTAETLASSGHRLGRLADAHTGVTVVTENWRELMPDATSVLTVLETAGNIGLLIDLGNWSMADKYEQLAAIADWAVTCHAKAHFDNGSINDVDYEASLTVLKDAGYTGALALVYESGFADGHDEWAGLDTEYAVTQRVFG